MSENWNNLPELITKKHLFNLLIAALVFAAGSILASRVRAAIDRASWVDSQRRLFLAKIGYWGVWFAAVAMSLGQIGVDIKVIVGAAGVLTVAIGFAAQTSASNLISGIFLMFEKPFVIGDVIAIGETLGEVLSIDLLSSKIRTANNLMVRVPNETLVKSRIINYSYFPVRRADFEFNIAYGTDLSLVEKILRDTARLNPLALDEPSPVFLMSGFNGAGMTIQFQIWTLPANLQTLQNEFYRDIPVIFERAGVRLVFPQLLGAVVPSQPRE